MPTLLIVGLYRFFCYAGDRDEPPHIHIERDNAEAKFWLEPIRFQSNRGFVAQKLTVFKNLLKTIKSNC